MRRYCNLSVENHTPHPWGGKYMCDGKSPTPIYSGMLGEGWHRGYVPPVEPDYDDIEIDRARTA